MWVDAPDIFPSKKAVARYISERFERSMRSILRDLATMQQGERRVPKCFPRADGQGYDLTEVQRYALDEGLEPKGGQEALVGSDTVDLKQHKLAQEARRIQAQADRHELELAKARGELVPRESRDRMLAQRMRLLKQGLRIELRNAAPDLLHAAGGDQTLLPEFKRACEELAERVMAKWYYRGTEDGHIGIDSGGVGSDPAQDIES